MFRLILIEEILHKKLQEYLKKSFVGFKGTTRWSVRSTSFHLKERVKRYFECLFCSGCRQLQKSLKMLD